MQDKLIKLFKKAVYEPSPELSFSVWKIINAHQKRMIRLKLWSLSLILFLSSVGLIPAFQMLLSDFAHSGFYEYFSLIFSDSGSMLTYWKELSFSLAESLPTMSIIFTLSLFFVCFLSLKYLMKQISRSQSINGATLSI